MVSFQIGNHRLCPRLYIRVLAMLGFAPEGSDRGLVRLDFVPKECAIELVALEMRELFNGFVAPDRFGYRLARFVREYAQSLISTRVIL